MHHRRGLRRLLNDDKLLDEIESKLDEANGLDEKRRAMLRYCIKLTQSPHQMNSSDVEALRNVGYEDQDILHIVEVAAYFAYVNRIADGLGVELESDRRK